MTQPIECRGGPQDGFVWEQGPSPEIQFETPVLDMDGQRLKAVYHLMVLFYPRVGTRYVFAGHRK